MLRARRERSFAQLLKLLRKMEGEWDARARLNARHFIANGKLSFIVFQHIPSKAVIENYVRETHRLLRPGALFKFQVTGCPGKQPAQDTYWRGDADVLVGVLCISDFLRPFLRKKGLPALDDDLAGFFGIAPPQRCRGAAFELLIYGEEMLDLAMHMRKDLT